MEKITRKKNKQNTLFKLRFKFSVIAILFFLFGLEGFAQNTTISGNVKSSSDGQGIPGVNISIIGSTGGTTTDIDGYYQLSVNEGDVLRFSFIGYKTEEVTVGKNSKINILMEDDISTLSEVVVVGYGTTTVKDATGSLTSITERDFNKGNIVTPENLLNGRVAGLTINTGGAPGSGSTIRIRGGSSLGASNDPLIVINGLPIDNNTIGGSRSILSTINPSDIESFTVLKDASATAIYGSRASNGVIIITTKKGTGAFKVNLDMQTGINTLSNKIDVFSADQFRELVNTERPDLVPLLGDANTDWQDAIYQQGFNSNINLSVQGAPIKNLPMRVSIGRNTQEGLRLTSRFERNSASLNINPDFFDGHLKVNLNANGTLERNRFAA